MLHRFMIVGADQVGLCLAQMLQQSGDFAVTLCDRDPEALTKAKALGLETLELSSSEALSELTRALKGAKGLIVLRNWWHPSELAPCAWAAGCAYIDTIESSASAAKLREARPADSALPMILGCGLSPGLASAFLAEELTLANAQSDLTLYVGVLPRVPENRLGYANIWGIDGLIEEYTEDCLTIDQGQIKKLPALSALEPLRIGTEDYEAFLTAGAIDDLVTEFKGRVRNLNFKTIRYPGHHDYMRFLLDDLGLSERIYRLRELLLTALPKSHEDHVLIHVRHDYTADAGSPREIRQRTFHFEGSGANLCGETVTALSELTARHVAAVAELLASGKIDASTPIGAGAILPAVLSQSRFLKLEGMRSKAKVKSPTP